MNKASITKVTVNMGIGRSKDDKAFVEEATNEIAQICGQKAFARKSRLAISNFKLREGELIGLCCTMRGPRALGFFEKLVHVVLPRVRDFRGVSPKSFDGAGNYTLGISEHSIFPEIDPNKATKMKGLEITIVTTCKTDDEAREFLKSLGMPFIKEKSNK